MSTRRLADRPLLNCDMGEGAGFDAQIMPLVQQASIACGGHAGDASTMRQTIALAMQHGVQVGAHPAYPDCENFGRQSLSLSPAALENTLQDQVDALAEAAETLGATLCYIKPHGALYHDVLRQQAVRDVMITVARARDLPLVVQAGAAFDLVAEAVERAGLSCLREAFADRQYEPDGALRTRGKPGALLSADAVANQVRHLLEHGSVVTADGADLPMRADTLCLHGDHSGAYASAMAARQVIDACR